MLLPARWPGVRMDAVNDLSEVRDMLAERVMEWTEEWKQRGLQQGLQQGLDSERHLMVRQVRRRFGDTVAAHSAPLLAQITEPTVLEDLGEALLDCADDAAWLARLDAASS